MSFFIFHLFSFESCSNFVFSMIDEAIWIVFFCANWLNCYKIFKMMRSSIEEFTKLISLWATSSIVCLETESFVFLTTKRNVFLNFSCCFLITNDLDLNFAWKTFVCIVNTNSFVDKILVLTIKLRYACEAMFRDFSLQMRSFSMFISFAVFDFEENWRFFFIDDKIDDDSSFCTWFFCESCSAIKTWMWTRFTINLFSSFVIAFTINDSFDS